MYRKFQIPIMLLLMFVFITLTFSLVNEEQISKREKEECFKECYIMNMDTCETLDKISCNSFDNVVRLYCCHECNIDVRKKDQTRKIITRGEI